MFPDVPGTDSEGPVRVKAPVPGNTKNTFLLPVVGLTGERSQDIDPVSPIIIQRYPDIEFREAFNFKILSQRLIARWQEEKNKGEEN